MESYKENTNLKEADLISKLIQLPILNLESRLTLFESQINKRRKLSNLLITELGTKRLRIEDELHRMRYSLLSSDGNRIKQHLLQVDDQISRELTRCFNDTIRLEYQRQRTNEELTNAREKFKIIEKV